MKFSNKTDNSKILLLTLSILFSPVVYGEENTSINIKVEDTKFYFMYTFGVENPLYVMDSYDNLPRDWMYWINYIFKFNETYKNSIISSLAEINKSGRITILDYCGDTCFTYKNYPQYRIIINPSYIWVYQGIRNTNLSKEEVHKLYSNMREFVYENISSGRFCFKGPEGDYFCPLLKQNLKYQEERWTAYIEIEKPLPEINDTNLELFKKLHPDYKYHPDDIKFEKRLRENYLFYYDHPRIRETVLLNFNPKEGWNDLLPYLELTEIIFAKTEQQRIIANEDIRVTRGVIKNIKSRIYSTRDLAELESLQKNLLNIDIDNSTASKLLKELEILERLEKEIPQGMDDIFHLVYLEKIRNHHDFLLRDIVTLKSAMVSLQIDYDETRSLAENKIHSLVREKWIRIGVIVAIVLSLFSLWHSNRTQSTFLKEYLLKIEGLTKKQIESLNKNSQNIIGKLDELIHSSKQKGK